MTTMQVLPLRLVTGATPERVRRAMWSLRASGSPASVSKVASVTVPTPGTERRIAASQGPSAAAVASWPSLAQSSSSFRSAWRNSGHRQVVGPMGAFERAIRLPLGSRCDLDARLLPPHPEGFGASTPILSRGHQMPSWTEMAVDHRVGGQEALRLLWRLEPL